MIINRISILRRLRLELQATLQRASRVRALPLIKVERLVARQQRKHILQTRNVAFTSTPTGRRVHAEPGLAGGFRHDCTVVARRVFRDRATTTTATTGTERVRATYGGSTIQARGCERTRARRGHRTRVGKCDAR
jgi:hypothetical protein